MKGDNPFGDSPDLSQMINLFIDKLFVLDCKVLGIIPEHIQDEQIMKHLNFHGLTPPRLTVEAHKILTLPKTNKQKINVLVVEVSHIQFMTKLVEPLFGLFGNKLLENLSDKLT